MQGNISASFLVLVSCWPASSHLLSVPPLALLLSFPSFHLCCSLFHSKCPSSCEALQPCAAPCLLREREKLGLQLTRIIRASSFSLLPFSTCLSLFLSAFSLLFRYFSSHSVCDSVTDTYSAVLWLLLLDVGQKQGMTLLQLETGLSFKDINQWKGLH